MTSKSSSDKPKKLNPYLKYTGILGAILIIALVEDNNRIYGNCDKQDLVCIEEKHHKEAARWCSSSIERYSGYDYRWLEDDLTDRFSFSKWRDKDKLIAAYQGDHLQFLNVNNQWLTMKYVCDYNIKKERVKAAIPLPRKLWD